MKNVTLSPDTIIAAGDATTLSTLDTLFLDQAVDVDKMDTSFTAEIRVTQPDNIVYMNTQNGSNLIVDIGPVLTTKTFDKIPTVGHGAIRWDVRRAGNTTKVSVTLTGPELLLSGIQVLPPDCHSRCGYAFLGNL